MTTLLRRKRGFSQRSVRPSLYTTQRQRQEPFYLLFLKVGSTILALFALVYLVLASLTSQSDYSVPYREHLLVKHTDNNIDSKESEKVDVLPTFTLSAKSKHDAFGIAQEYLSNVNDEASRQVLQFIDAAKQLRRDFSERYGGEVLARALLERSLHVVKKQNAGDDSNNAMAQRIDNAAQDVGVLSMAFGGSSAVAGYGNFFHQSFPFVFENALKDPLELLGVTLQVRNGAVGHSAIFPYAWCRENFMGDHLDVALLDFGSMSLQQLEAVIRNLVGSNREAPPLLIFRDSKSKERLALIQSYVDAGVLVVPIIIDLQAAFAPFQNVKDEVLPPGLKQWKEFGAPPGAPGKVRQNLTLKQHELFGWILSMHVLSAAELVVSKMLGLSDKTFGDAPPTPSKLPRPQSDKMMKSAKWSSLLYGTPSDESYTEWNMPSLSCRTAFDPVVSGSLESAIIGGTSVDDVDLLHPKGAMYYVQGWVLDLEPAERREKQLMKQWDNLGFQDYTKAYYAVPTSGKLSLFLPAEGQNDQHNARDAFKQVVVCESNAKVDGNGCNLGRDVTFTIGGVEASSVQWIVDDAVAYHGKRLCVLVDIPENAKLVSEQEAKRAVEERIQAKQQQQVRKEDRLSLEATTTGTMGLALDVDVTNNAVTLRKGACSIAHLIWESV